MEKEIFKARHECPIKPNCQKLENEFVIYKCSNLIRGEFCFAGIIMKKETRKNVT